MNPTLIRCILIAAYALLATSEDAKAAPPKLKPLMAIPGKPAVKHDFSKSTPLKKTDWLQRQGTRWAIEDGVLRGLPSSKEFQARKTHHRGLEARLSVPKTPTQFIASFSLRFIDGQETAIVPFVEFGHHVCRLKFSRDGAFLLVDQETLKVAEAKDFQYESGKWYHVLAELKGDEFVMQFEEGPTFYVRHACLAKPNPSGGNGLGVAGPRSGKVEIDNLTIWNVQPKSQSNWLAKRDALPKFKPVPTGKVKKQKAK